MLCARQKISRNHTQNVLAKNGYFIATAGFHLIELLITLAIIGILIAISVPIYSQHLVTEKRLEACGMLAKLAIAMEQFNIAQDTYAGATLSMLGFPSKIVRENYQLNINLATFNDYVLAAIPLGNQASKDSACGTLLLNSRGERKIEGPGKIEDCC